MTDRLILQLVRPEDHAHTCGPTRAGVLVFSEGCYQIYAADTDQLEATLAFLLAACCIASVCGLEGPSLAGITRAGDGRVAEAEEWSRLKALNPIRDMLLELPLVAVPGMPPAFLSWLADHGIGADESTAQFLARRLRAEAPVESPGGPMRILETPIGPFASFLARWNPGV